MNGEKFCTHCGKLLRRHKDERPYAFKVRKTCGPACAGAQREKAKKKKPQVKLTDDMVRAIKWRLVSGDRVDVVAKDFGVSVTTIRNIQTGVTWRHVEI